MSDRRNQSLARRLIPIFLAWKTVLLLVATFSPGPGYDTSALILLNSSTNRHAELQSPSLVDRITLNTFRWDAFYFVKSAQRGHVYEQEWAFSWAYSYVLNTAAQYLSGDPEPSLRHHIWAGIVISNVCHLISVLVLFRLLNVALGRNQNGRIPFIASLLHVMSPAGLFLCSPYTEALFSAFNFTGMLHYALARTTATSNRTWTIQQDAYMLSSGVLFASATLVRGNGLLSGLIYLCDVASFLPRIMTMQLSGHEVRRLVVTCVAGIFVAIGFISPQFLAYKEYCVTDSSSATARPWCDRNIPSIYTWVQSTYWNVGFLRYWTLPNLPLFLIAAPMLWLLFKSSVTVLRNHSQPSLELHVPQTARPAYLTATDSGSCVLPQLAVPQFVLAIGATTSFHVQIINRLSSGYPIWYLVVAGWIAVERKAGNRGKNEMLSQWVVRTMIMYSIIQGVLFASFLPPA